MATDLTPESGEYPQSCEVVIDYGHLMKAYRDGAIDGAALRPSRAEIERAADGYVKLIAPTLPRAAVPGLATGEREAPPNVTGPFIRRVETGEREKVAVLRRLLEDDSLPHIGDCSPDEVNTCRGCEALGEARDTLLALLPAPSSGAGTEGQR